ncbi:MAG: hypothetical protein AABZ30_05965, partial [Myxococcota bacterium]
MFSGTLPVRPLREIVSAIRGLQADIGRNLYELGRLLATARDHELWRGADRASFASWVEEDLDMGRSTAYRAIDVYENFSPTIAARYGPEKLEALVAYIHATPADERPGDILAHRLRLRADDGRFVHKSVHQAQAVEVWDAVGLLNEAKLGRDRIPRALRDGVTRLAERMPAAPRAIAGRSRIRLRRDRKRGALC